MSETSKQANMQIPICLKFVFVKKFAYADRIIKKSVQIIINSICISLV